MRAKIRLILELSLLSIIIFSTSVRAWESFALPRIIVGGSAGYFRISLDDFDNVYSSRWNYIYSGDLNIRVYRSTFLSIQYAKYNNEKAKNILEIKNNSQKKPNWQEEFLNLGIRWYSTSRGKWNFYTGFGFNFVTIKEEPEFSVFFDNGSKKRQGKGLYLEIGTNYIIISPVALSMEFEISSIGEAGYPGFIGHSIGGYTFLVGVDFIL